MSHSFQRVESNNDLDLAEEGRGAPATPVPANNCEPAGQMDAGAADDDGLTMDDIIHSSVKKKKDKAELLSFNVEPSDRQKKAAKGKGAAHPKAADGRGGGGGGGGLGSLFSMLASCCLVRDSQVDRFSRGGGSAGQAYHGYDAGSAGAGQKKRPRVFSRGPGTPAGSRKKFPVSSYSDNGVTGGLLPPQSGSHLGRKTLVLDLDETLVHSSFEYLPDADLTLPVEVAGITQQVYVRKRPGLEKFLEFVGEHYEVGVFTASVVKYADAVLDQIDPTRVVKWRLFRESCCQTSEGFYVKDLGCLGRRLENTIIIDNSPHSYLFHPENAIGIKSFVDDRQDNHLIDLIPFLQHARDANDVREALLLLSNYCNFK